MLSERRLSGISFLSTVAPSTRGPSKEIDVDDSQNRYDFDQERRLNLFPKSPLVETTVMLRNLPQCFTRARLLYLLCKEGFAGQFNFVYVPLCFRAKNTLCYAFINFMTLGALADFTKRFNGRRWDIPGNEQVAEVCPCERHQGLNSIIQYYRNNSVMHPSVPDECKPILLSGTKRIPFPGPLKKIKMPKKLKASDPSDEDNTMENDSPGVPGVEIFMW
eukprot:symbB.v1.2.019523.t1/scaffold1597.1/size110265/6